MKNKPTLKQDLYDQCLRFIDLRLKTVKNQIEDVILSLTSETKSSAGDKHETGRAMLQLEREKLGNQLAEIQKIKEQLSKISLVNNSKIVSLGSVVFTTQFNYFIAISAGMIKSDQDAFYAISPETPIGKLLLSKSIGDDIQFRDQSFKILEVL